METKKCTKCNKVKTIDKFRLRRDKRGDKLYISYRNECKECQKYYQKNIAPNAFWSKLKFNLKRHYGGFIYTPLELKESIGYPEICYLCGMKITNIKDAELDHIKPLSKGGKTELNNLMWAHKTCNRMKHDLMLDEMIKLMEAIINNKQAIMR
jgi:hypothetical protein